MNLPAPTLPRRALQRGQTLERLCLYLLTAELNIRFAYPLMTATFDRPFASFGTWRGTTRSPGVPDAAGCRARRS